MSDAQYRQPLIGKQELAASLVAEDKLTNIEIATQAKVTDRTLLKWKALPLFKAAVADYQEQIRKRVLSEGIARVDVRVAELKELRDKLQGVMQARSIQHQDVPGGDTGILLRQVKFVKVFEIRHASQAALDAGTLTPDDLTDADFIATKQTQAVEEYGIDDVLLGNIIKMHNQAAIELGQRVEKKELSGSIDFVEQAAGTLNQKLLQGVVTGGAAGVSGDAEPA